MNTINVEKIMENMKASISNKLEKSVGNYELKKLGCQRVVLDTSPTNKNEVRYPIYQGIITKLDGDVSVEDVQRLHNSFSLLDMLFIYQNVDECEKNEAHFIAFSRRPIYNIKGAISEQYHQSKRGYALLRDYPQTLFLYTQEDSWLIGYFERIKKIERSIYNLTTYQKKLIQNKDRLGVIDLEDDLSDFCNNHLFNLKAEEVPPFGVLEELFPSVYYETAIQTTLSLLSSVTGYDEELYEHKGAVDLFRIHHSSFHNLPF